MPALRRGLVIALLVAGCNTTTLPLPRARRRPVVRPQAEPPLRASRQPVNRQAATLSFEDIGLTSGRAYSYVVAAEDANGTELARTPSISATPVQP